VRVSMGVRPSCGSNAPSDCGRSDRNRDDVCDHYPSLVGAAVLIGTRAAFAVAVADAAAANYLFGGKGSQADLRDVPPLKLAWRCEDVCQGFLRPCGESIS
jgi:hypothetical protein